MAHARLAAAWDAGGPVAARARAFLADVRLRDLRVAPRALAAAMGAAMDPDSAAAGENPDGDDVTAARLCVVFNPKRKTEKRKPSPDLVLVQQPWQDGKFNFFKVPEDEVVLEDEVARVVFNVFPIRAQHFIVHSQQPLAQNFASEESLKFLVASLRMALELRAERWILAFNSFGAFASVNHLHTHVMPHPIPHGGRSIVETAAFTSFAQFPWGSILGPADSTSLRARCIVFELAAEAHLEAFAKHLRAFLAVLAQRDIAHNFFTLDIAGAPFRLAVFPRREKAFTPEDARIVPGGFEIFGMPIVFDDDLFTSFAERDYASLRSSCELDQGALDDLLAAARDATG